MFGFLKDKLKSALSVFSKKVDEEGEEEVKEQVQYEVKESNKELKKEEKKSEKKAEVNIKDNIEHEKLEGIKKEIVKEIMHVEEKKQEVVAHVVEEKKGFFSKLKGKFVSKEIPVEQKVEAKPETKISEIPVVEQKIVVENETKVESFEEEKKGFFTSIKEKITTKTINAVQFDELFWNLELVLLENNVAVSVIEKIKADLKLEIVDRPLPRARIEESIKSALRNSVSSLFEFPSFNLIEFARTHKPFVICLVGVNGSGKTTSVAKLVRLFEKNGLSCVIAAADTFRAAAIDQLQLHADALGARLIKHDYGADAAAVAFDAIKHAEAKNKSVVLIDTAGRLHSNVNLMDEMKKIIRVAKPHLKLFIGESITGNDCVEQARLFDEAIGIDGIILSKADIDEKGGASLSVSYVTKKPILYLGVGQGYDDLEVFDKEKMIKRLGL